MPEATIREIISIIARTEDPGRLTEGLVALFSKGKRGIREAIETIGPEEMASLWRKAAGHSAGRLLEAALQAYAGDDGPEGADWLRLIPPAEINRKALQLIADRRFAGAAPLVEAACFTDRGTIPGLVQAYLQAGRPDAAMHLAEKGLRNSQDEEDSALASAGSLAAARAGELTAAGRLLKRALVRPERFDPETAETVALMARGGAAGEAEEILAAVGLFPLNPPNTEMVIAAAGVLARSDLSSVEEWVREFGGLLRRVEERSRHISDPRALPEETAHDIQILASGGLDRCMALTRLFEAWQGPVVSPVKVRLLILNLFTTLDGRSGRGRVETVIDDSANGQTIALDDGLLSFAIRQMLEAEIESGGRRIAASVGMSESGRPRLAFHIENVSATAPSGWSIGIARKICDELGVRYTRDALDEGAVLLLAFPAPDADAAPCEAGTLAETVRRATEDQRHDTAEVLSFLVHDLKNGFSFISHWAGEIETGKHPLATIEARITENIVKMGGYIDECLKYLALQEDESTDLFSLEEVIREVARLLGGSCAARGVGLNMRITPGLPSYRGKRERILSVLLNLGKNALEAMDAAGELCFFLQMTDSGCFELSVSDTGPGLTADAQKRLFQLGGKPARGTGRGIGLWAVRRHIAREGGEIEVSSDSAGTAFCISLPGPSSAYGRGGDPDLNLLNGEAAQAWRAAVELAGGDNPPWDTVRYLMERAVKSQFQTVFSPAERRSSLVATTLRLIETGSKGARRGRVLPALVQHIQARFAWADGTMGVEEHLRRVLRAVADDGLARELEDFMSLAIWLVVYGRAYSIGGVAVPALVLPTGWNEAEIAELAAHIADLSSQVLLPAQDPSDAFLRTRRAAGEALRLMQERSGNSNSPSIG